MKNVIINLKENEFKLLLSILEEASDNRSDMTCNDPEENEEKLFTKKERTEIGIKLAKSEYWDFDEEDEDAGDFLSNWNYVDYLRLKLSEQINTKKKKTKKK